MYYTYAHYTADKSRLFYIGKGKKNRMHVKDSRSQHWHNIVNKYGLHVELLAEWQTEQEAFDHEKFLIHCFKELSDICNLTDGGEGCSGYIWSEEQKLKARGRVPHNAGKTMSAAQKKHLSEIQKGKKRPPHSKEHSERIAKALSGKTKSSEHLKKMSENGKLQGKLLRVCPHCEYQGYGVNIFRYHFDRCPKKGNAWD